MTTLEQLIELINKVPYKDVEVCLGSSTRMITTETYTFYGIKFEYNSISMYHCFLNGVHIDDINGTKMLKILREKIKCKNFNHKEDTIQSAVNKLKKVLNP